MELANHRLKPFTLWSTVDLPLTVMTQRYCGFLGGGAPLLLHFLFTPPLRWGSHPLSLYIFLLEFLLVKDPAFQPNESNPCLVTVKVDDWPSAPWGIYISAATLRNQCKKTPNRQTNKQNQTDKQPPSQQKTIQTNTAFLPSSPSTFFRIDTGVKMNQGRCQGSLGRADILSTDPAHVLQRGSPSPSCTTAASLLPPVSTSFHLVRCCNFELYTYLRFANLKTHMHTTHL